MKRFHLLAWALICWSLPVLGLAPAARASTPPELVSLTKSWFESIDRVVKPIDQTYRRELEKLFTQLTREGKLNEAVAVKAESEAVEKNPYLAADSTPAPEAEQPLPLARIRKLWLASRSRTITPKNDVYLRDLERLQDNLTRSKRLEDALAVKEEIEKLKSGQSLALAAGVRDTTFAGKRWRTRSGSTFVFKVDGSGTQANASGREWPTRWTMSPDGLITLDGWADDQKSTWYFRFDDEGNGVFGATSEILNNAVTAQ